VTSSTKNDPVIDPDIRLANHDDADDLAQLDLLEGEARAAVVDQRGGARWLAEHPCVGSTWGAVVSRANSDVAVAHIGPVLVGYLVADLGADMIVRVDQVWVTPEARENGFGDALLAFVIDRARTAGAVGVEGQALPGDRHTKNLYERAGIVARLITTYKTL
jgi:GNAT superfamily N-acetyltransferase